MIASLKGIVEYLLNPYIIVDVNGVGYKVLVSNEVLSKISSIGQAIKLFTYTHVKEDALELYGFLNLEDLKLFEYLISVSGVGPKTAMSIFTVHTRPNIINAIIQADAGFFTSVPRLGTKNAQKIIIELKSKFGSISDLDLSSTTTKDSQEVIGALKTLGFSSKEAGEAVRSIKDQGLTTEKKIREALKYLGK